MSTLRAKRLSLRCLTGVSDEREENQSNKRFGDLPLLASLVDRSDEVIYNVCVQGVSLKPTERTVGGEFYTPAQKAVTRVIKAKANPDSQTPVDPDAKEITWSDHIGNSYQRGKWRQTHRNFLFLGILFLSFEQTGVAL